MYPVDMLKVNIHSGLTLALRSYPTDTITSPQTRRRWPIHRPYQRLCEDTTGGRIRKNVEGDLERDPRSW